MRRTITLITGANGEVGHGLIRQLRAQPNPPDIVVLDLRSLDADVLPYVDQSIVGDILDVDLLENLSSEYDIETVYHLAALLSTHSEFRPDAAHRVNVRGTLNLLEAAVATGVGSFVYTSTTSVLGDALVWRI